MSSGLHFLQCAETNLLHHAVARGDCITTVHARNRAPPEIPDPVVVVRGAVTAGYFGLRHNTIRWYLSQLALAIVLVCQSAQTPEVHQTCGFHIQDSICQVVECAGGTDATLSPVLDAVWVRPVW